MNLTSCINLAGKPGFTKTLCLLIAWTMLATQCTKQIVQTEEANTDRMSALQRSQKSTTLTVNAYPGDPERPVHWPIAGSDFFIGSTSLEMGRLEIRNDNHSLFLILNDVPWKSASQNLNIWIGLTNSPLPLSPNGMPNVSKFPVQLSVPAGTDKYCVEIEFAMLSQYLGEPINCESAFSMLVQADVLQNGKAYKAWAGNEKKAGNAASNTYFWFSMIDAYCGTEMPPP